MGGLPEKISTERRLKEEKEKKDDDDKKSAGDRLKDMNGLVNKIFGRKKEADDKGKDGDKEKDEGGPVDFLKSKKMIEAGAIVGALLEETRIVLDQTDFVADSFGKDVQITPVTKSVVGAVDYGVEVLDCAARAGDSEVKLEMCPMKYLSALADAFECIDYLTGMKPVPPGQAPPPAQAAPAPTQASAWGAAPANLQAPAVGVPAATPGAPQTALR